MSKGVFGLGCSYTWGEGLYYYSDLDNLPFKSEHHFNPDSITPAMELYKDNNKFIKLVADYLNTWWWTNRGNGGTNMSNLTYAKEGFYTYDKFKRTDFKLMILQFTNYGRDYCNGIEAETQIKEADKVCKDFEKDGAKVITFCWDEEIGESDTYYNLFKKRHIDIEVDGIVKSAFDYFIWNDEYNITVQSDFIKDGFQKNDLHFNLRGHKIIADLIINKLKKDNFTIDKKII